LPSLCSSHLHSDLLLLPLAFNSSDKGLILAQDENEWLLQASADLLLIPTQLEAGWASEQFSDLAGYWITPVAPDIALTSLQFEPYLAILPLLPSNSDRINAITP
jgi:hypothetical protein